MRVPVRAQAGLWARSPVWGLQEAAHQRFSAITDVSLSPSPFLSEVSKNVFFKKCLKE